MSASPKPAPRSAKKSEDITVKLITRFGDLLANGSLAPGTRLPPERELALMFGVSRNSLRQALKMLAVIGVIHQQSGRGTFLSNDSSQILREPLRFVLLLESGSYAELLEIRFLVEPELTARAAARANLASLNEIEQCLQEMEGAGDDLSRIVEADVRFHRAIYRAAGNRLCETIFSVIHQSLLDSVTLTSRSAKASFIVKLHRNIYRAIFDRDPEKARLAMVHHLVESQKVLASELRPAGNQSGQPVFAPLVQQVAPRRRQS